VVPANLRDKWQTELLRRFDRDVPILKREDLSKFLDNLDAGLDPDLVGIIGIETMRTYPRLDELATKWPRIDLAIIDEAHSLRNSGTKTAALGSLLSDIADSLVFLSATPINLHKKDLFNLLNMLDEGEFPDFVEFQEQLEPVKVLNNAASRLLSSENLNTSEIIEYLESISEMTYGHYITEHPDFEDVISLLEINRKFDPETVAKVRRKLANLSPLSSLLTRTRKIDVPGDKAVREPRNLQVPWTPLESEYYKTLQDTLTAEVLARGGIPGFELQMPLRQAASCLPASIELMKEKRGVSEELVDDDDTSSHGTMFETISVSPVLEKILAKWDLSKNVDTKYDQLLFALNNLPSSPEHKNRNQTPVLLFSFFRPTLEYLQRRLTQDGKRVGLMYGKTPMNDRKKIMKEFRDGSFDILLVSEVGSEGLDFEFCNVLVNYDLPWNPMRVEQRIGRLDRFGQKSEKIFIFNLEIPDTIEGQIIGRLYNRIDIFRLALGDLEPILGEVDSLLRMTLDPSLSEDQKKQRQEEIMVAIESRIIDLGDLEENRGNLLGLDSAAIEGFTDSTPGAGKYIGEVELKNFLDYGLVKYKSRLKQGPIPDTYKLEGTPALADDLMRRREFKEGTSLGRDRLIQLCRDGAWIEITFKSDLASREDTELMSIRHPIARIVELAMREDLALERFGSIALT
jgi:superfamily II DNA or RNA helicase